MKPAWRHLKGFLDGLRLAADVGQVTGAVFRRMEATGQLDEAEPCADGLGPHRQTLVQRLKNGQHPRCVQQLVDTPQRWVGQPREAALAARPPSRGDRIGVRQALLQYAQRMGGQIVGADRAERAAKPADRRANRFAKKSFRHEGAPV